MSGAAKSSALAAALAFFISPAMAEEPVKYAPVSFQGKTINMIIGYGAGGSLDNYGRLIAPYLTQRLPGNPTIVIRNVTGADGVVGLNSFYTQAKPDGLTITIGGATQVDPLHFLSANAVYDVAKLALVGGNTRAGTAVVISKEAKPRLLDPKAKPAVMGALAAVRTGMQSTLWGAEYLGWNAKWVLGYPTAKALVL
jgi:tripartite-type tricarboxylate transporter receptor subunit TctC